MAAYLKKHLTLVMIVVAALVHVVLLWQFYGKNQIVEVPLEAEVISTQLALNLTARPAPQKTKSAPVKKSPPKVAKPIKKTMKTLTSPQAKSVPLPPTQKAQTKTKTAPKTKSVAAKAGGGQARPSQDEIRRYINKVARRIDRKKRYPRLSRQNGEQGVIKVKLTLGRGGELLHYRLMHESSFKRLSEATLATIRAAAPYPPLPSTYTQAKMTIEVPVRFHLARGR